MLQFSANLTSMYGNLPVTKAMSAAKTDGFNTVECRSPFDFPPKEINSILQTLDLYLLQFNTPMGDFKSGDRGLACRPGRQEEFRNSIDLSLEYARVLRVPQINCCAGLIYPNENPEEVNRILIENLRYAALRGAEVGVRVQLEAINSQDTPQAFLSDINHVVDILDKVNHFNLFIQYDFYHEWVMGTNVLSVFDELEHRINHVQVADYPGRHEPGTGEIPFNDIFARLERSTYDRWVGLEYIPCQSVKTGLKWRDHYVKE